MKPIRNDSHMEIWNTKYINGDRTQADKNLKVIQIECGNSGDYIVEVVDETKKGED